MSRYQASIADSHGAEKADTTLKLFVSPVIDEKVARPMSPVTTYLGTFYDTEKGNGSSFDSDSTLELEMPSFRRQHEATTSELFYDLFFVANLTTFTASLYINSSVALSSYTGFFCLLWFTWYQVSLYDLRFVVDSIFYRICKACQFGVMVGFAVIGPQWDPTEEKFNYSPFRAFSIILMASRLVLALQYSSTLWCVRQYRQFHLPLGLTTAIYFVSGFVYLCTYYVFPKDGEAKKSTAYLVWYVVSVVETVGVLAIASWRPIISFVETHIVQRMSLLTLIILGEGIIVITKAISYIVKNNYAFSICIVGQIISAIAIVYLLHMLYFDWLSEKDFGVIRQQVWSFLHFPLHLCLVLLLSGVAQFIIWRQAVESVNKLTAALTVDLQRSYNGTGSLVEQLDQTIKTEVFKFLPKDFNSTKAIEGVSEALEAIRNIPAANLTSSQDSPFWTPFRGLFLASSNAILEALGVKPPKGVVGKMPDAVFKLSTGPNGAAPAPAAFDELFADASKLTAVINLVFVYFFITAGLTLLLMGVLGAMNSMERGFISRLRHVPNFIIGPALCLLSLMSYTDAEDRYAASPWVLPTACLSFGIVLVCNHLHRLIPNHHPSVTGMGDD